MKIVKNKNILSVQLPLYNTTVYECVCVCVCVATKISARIGFYDEVKRNVHN
jgi:hypothetical protein